MKTRLHPLWSLLLIFCFVFQNCSNEKAADASTSLDEPKEKASLVKQEIAPPLEKIDVDFKTYLIEPAEAQTLEFETGTTIEIPADAFVDADGNKITTPVTVKYREFHNAAQILASGIPMDVLGENGQKMGMQTAGMFEIRGFASEKPVYIDDQKEVNVNMASYVNDHVYDFWSYDEEAGDWANMGVSEARPNEQKTQAISQIEKEEKSLQQPVRPAKFNKNKPVLNFDINLKAFPELSELGSIMWQYSGNDPQKDPVQQKWIFNEAWDFAEIKPLDGGRYELLLRNESKTFTTPVIPSQKGEKFEEALASYNQNLKEYQDNMMSLQEMKGFRQRQANFVRSFRVNGFGIFNYDLLFKLPESVHIMADFDFGLKIPNLNQMVTIFHITNDGRSVVKYDYNSFKKFNFSPLRDNKLVAILPNNQIATFSQKDFDAAMNDIRASGGQIYTFKMTVQEEVIRAIADVQRVIEDMAG